MVEPSLPCGGQQHQPPSTVQQQQQPPSTGQQLQQPPSIGQQHQQLPSKRQKQPQPTSTVQQHQQPPSKRQKQPQPTSTVQQHQQPPSTGQQQPQPTSTVQQHQQPPSTQTNLLLIISQAFAKIRQQNPCAIPNYSPAYIPPKQPTTHVTPSSIIPLGVHPQYLTSQTLPTLSLTMPAPSPLRIEVRNEIHIRNEIDDFSEVLEALKTKICEKFGDYDDAFPNANAMKHLIGSDEERRGMYKESVSMRLMVDHTAEIQYEMNHILLPTIRNVGFLILEKIQDANAVKNWTSTPKFSSIIAATPLDPISEEKKRLFIQLYNAIDQKLQEIEIMMEEMLLHSSDNNEKQTIRHTIGLLEQNVELLHTKLDKISEQVDTVKLNRQIPRITHSNSGINPFEILNRSLEQRRVPESKNRSDRIVELRDFLLLRPTAATIKPRNPNPTRTEGFFVSPKVLPPLISLCEQRLMSVHTNIDTAQDSQFTTEEPVTNVTDHSESDTDEKHTSSCLSTGQTSLLLPAILLKEQIQK